MPPQRDDAVALPVPAASPRDELAADQLVRLVAAYADARLDPADPAHAAWMAWRAREARAALSPADRLALDAEARAFARRVMAQRAGPLLVDAPPDAREVEPQVGREAVRAAAAAGCAARFDQGVAAGVGQELWDEPCASWVEVPREVEGGQFVALTVRGDSMEPMLHDGDTLLVRLGVAPAAGDVIVARRPDDGYVVKRVASPPGREIVLESMNPRYAEVTIPNDLSLVVGTVVLRWCGHGVRS